MRYATFFTPLIIILTFQFLPAQAPDTLWTRFYNLGTGWGNNWTANCIQQTLDAGYIVSGERTSLAPVNAVLIKTNFIGDTIWTKKFMYTNTLNSVQQALDSGYIAIGYNRLIKTDKNGDTLWTKELPGTFIQQTNDSGYIAIIELYGLTKIDEYGDTLWTKPYVTSNGYVQQTFDNGYILVNNDKIIKTDEFGDSLWAKSFQGSYKCVKQTCDSCYIAIGSCGGHLCVIKTNESGDSLWSYVSNNSPRIYGMGGHFIENTKDGEFILAGGGRAVMPGAFNDVIIMKIDPMGNVSWTKTLFWWGISTCIRQATDGGYVCCGYTEGFQGWVMKLAPDPLGFDNQEYSFTDRYSLSQNYPNPFNPTTTIRYDLPKTSDVLLKIYNILGQEVVTLVEEKQSAGQKTVVWDGCNKVGQTVGSGIYIYQIKAGHFVQSRKMMLLR